jgi:hypothetical protein
LLKFYRSRGETTIADLFRAFITETQDTARCNKEIIRLLSFQEHTCCRADECIGEVEIKLFDEDEAAEIHDEERILIEEFEAFVEELEKEHEAMGVPLWEFIQAHWCERLREYVVEHEEVITPDLLCVILAKRAIENE